MDTGAHVQIQNQNEVTLAHALELRQGMGVANAGGWAGRQAGTASVGATARGRSAVRGPQHAPGRLLVFWSVDVLAVCPHASQQAVPQAAS